MFRSSFKRVLDDAAAEYWKISNYERIMYSDFNRFDIYLSGLFRGAAPFLSEDELEDFSRILEVYIDRIKGMVIE